ncbi:TadE-like protein [Abditibacterium utsteinense]|uniref:TadE-like protein n=1 Tax=Abditibacterium utsteinense TaxID=1960156 RepID=A0A2S8SXC3_9BACT|nr:TadE family protein [Abditibacterium utsteinense]PQV65450.1 TadE-like protein [Abditibacterium utsteinense]
MTTNTFFSKVPKRGGAPGFQRAAARRRGVALVEFAMISTLFFTMLLGLIQFGIYQSTANTLWNLSREGARFASVGTPTDQEIEDYVRRIAPPNIKSSNLGKPTISPATRVSGQPVTVGLAYDMKDKLIFLGVGDLLKKTYSTASTMRVE